MSPSAQESADGVLRETAGDLLRYFERRVPNRADAADLLGETLLQAWRRIDDLPTGPTERSAPGSSPSLRTYSPTTVVAPCVARG